MRLTTPTLYRIIGPAGPVGEPGRAYEVNAECTRLNDAANPDEGLRVVYYKVEKYTPMIEAQPTVDRTGENDADPEVIVTLPCGHTERFWMTGLSDAEYIRRAKAIKALDTQP